MIPPFKGEGVHARLRLSSLLGFVRNNRIYTPYYIYIFPTKPQEGRQAWGAGFGLHKIYVTGRRLVQILPHGEGSDSLCNPEGAFIISTYDR